MLLRNPNLHIQQSAQFLSNIGTWVHRTALVWYMWHLTSSGSWLGILVAAEIIPLLVLSPFGGVISDRYGGLRANGFSLAGMLIVSSLFFAAVLLEFDTPFLLVAFNFVMGFFVAVNGPAWQDMISMIYPRAQVPRVVSISSFNFNMGRMAGPILSLVIIDQWGVAAAFCINALSYVLPLWAIGRYKIVNPKGSGTSGGGIAREMWEGFRYIRRDAFTGAILLMMLATSFFARPYMDLFPAMADLLFNRKDDGPMLLLSATGAGALFAGLGLAVIGFHPKIHLWPKLSSLLFAAAIIAIMLSPNLAWALPFSALAGFAMVSNALASTSLLQHNTDPAYRGRVMGVYFLTFRGGMALGALAAGVVLDFWRVDGVFIVAAVVMAFLSLWGFNAIRGNERG